jgi:hypothetical protein
MVFSKKINNKETILNLSKQTQGVYFVKIKTDEGVITEKNIKR